MMTKTYSAPYALFTLCIIPLVFARSMFICIDIPGFLLFYKKKTKSQNVFEIVNDFIQVFLTEKTQLNDKILSVMNNNPIKLKLMYHFLLHHT